MNETSDIDHLLASWASWHRASAAERLAHWWAPQVAWADGAVSNFMTAPTDSADYWDSKHSQRMRSVDAAVSDLPARLRSAIYQTLGLGTIGQPMLRDNELRLTFEIAVIELEPKLVDRGLCL